MTKKSVVIGGIGLIITIAFLLLNFLPKQNFTGELARITLIQGQKEVVILAEVAKTAEERRVGLSQRKNLSPDRGMLFVFDDEVRPSFWMKDTLIPLDLIFISQDLTISEVKKSFDPCRKDSACPIYVPLNKISYVLEVNGGFCDEKGIHAGSKVRLDL